MGQSTLTTVSFPSLILVWKDPTHHSSVTLTEGLVVDQNLHLPVMSLANGTTPMEVVSHATWRNIYTSETETFLEMLTSSVEIVVS